jgi:hypothetical protein
VFAQRGVDEDVRRHDFRQNQPYERRGFQSSIIQGGFPGGMTTSQQPYFNNSLAGGIGGGLAGFGAGSAFAGLEGLTGASAAFAPYAPFVLGGLGALGGML